NQDPLNFPIRTNNRLASLLRVVNTGEGRPIGNAEPIFNDLQAELKAETDRLQKVLGTYLPRFNQLAQRLSIEPISEKGTGGLPKLTAPRRSCVSVTLKRGLAVAAVYSSLAIAMTWPLAARPASVLPHDAYDPTLVTWILWWDAHTRPFTEQWWNAPFFWPMKGALALSEHLAGVSILTTPLQWFGLTPVASYNVAFLASFPLAALAFHALAVALTGRHDVAAVGAVAWAFGPYRFAQVSHLQMLWTFGVPLALLALHRYHD